MANNLKEAYDCIKQKITPYSLLYAYRDGKAPLKYSTLRLQRAFNNFSVYFSQNWCGVVIDAVLDRLTLKGFDIQNSAQNARIDEIFKEQRLQLDAYDAHEAALITGEAFIIAEKVDSKISAYYNDPRLTAVFYDEANSKVKSYAAKEWKDDEGNVVIALYYPDRTEIYKSPSGKSVSSFVLNETLPNETGIIPVFHFRVSRRDMKGDIGLSELSIQDSINKLYSDLMVAAEFEAFKMRVFISQTDPGDVKIGPDMHMWIASSENGTQAADVKELGGSSLENFLKPMSNLANTMAVTTRTPKHYFMDTTGGNISGDALIAMESPLQKKVLQRQENFSVTWQELASYLLLLDGENVSVTDILPIWEPLATIQPLQQAQVLQAEVTAGVPLVVAAKRAGWDDSEIQQLTGS